MINKNKWKRIHIFWRLKYNDLYFWNKEVKLCDRITSSAVKHNKQWRRQRQNTQKLAQCLTKRTSNTTNIWQPNPIIPSSTFGPIRHHFTQPNLPRLLQLLLLLQECLTSTTRLRNTTRQTRDIIRLQQPPLGRRQVRCPEIHCPVLLAWRPRSTATRPSSRRWLGEQPPTLAI